MVRRTATKIVRKTAKRVTPSRRLKVIAMDESFHLPRLAWKEVQEQQKETHPTMESPEYTYDVVKDTIKRETVRGDRSCPSGLRRVTITIELYYTVTIKVRFVADPKKKCMYKIEVSWTNSPLKVRITDHKEGECVPVKKKK